MQSFSLEYIIDNHDTAHTWEFCFNQINMWWPRSFFTSQRTRRFHIDTFIGGKVFEDFGEGDGLIWGDVIGVDYLRSLQIRGHLTRAFGGPAISFEKFEFIPKGEDTRLVYTVDFIGDIAESGVQSVKKGWEQLLGVHFVDYCKQRS